MSLLLNVCQYIHSVATVGLPNFIHDRSKIVGTRDYILMVLAHYDKYNWSEELAVEVEKVIRGVGSPNWKVTITPSIFTPGGAVFKICSASTTLRIVTKG